MASQEIPAEISQFVDKLIAEKGFPDLDSEVMAQVKQDLADRVEDRINAELINNLNPEQIAAFEKLLDAGDEPQTQEFLRTNIPDLQNVIASALLRFRTIYLSQ